MEVGCSAGFVTAFLRSIGYDIEGIDISESAIKYAKSTFGPFYNLQPKEKQYDIIMHLGLIGCVDDPEEFLSGFLDLLKPNGEMFFNAPNIESPKQLGELWVSTPPPDLIYLFNERSFQYMLNNSFNVTTVKVFAKREVIWKNIKKIMNKNYNIYPKIFRQNQQVYDEKRVLVKKMFSRIAMVTAYAIYPLLKKYYNEYGGVRYDKKEMMTINYQKLLQGHYEAECLPSDFSLERIVPDFAFNILNPLGLLYRLVADEAYLANGGQKPSWPDGKPLKSEEEQYPIPKTLIYRRGKKSEGRKDNF